MPGLRWARVRWPTPLIVARGLGSMPLLGAGAATVIAWFVLPERPIAVLARDDVFSVIWPLVPSLLAGAVPAALAFEGRSLERTAGRSAIGLRLRALALLSSTAAATVALSPYDATTSGRSVLVLVGLALVGLAALPPTVAWVPIAFYPPACWLLGTRSTGVNAAWAVPLRPADDPAAWRIAVGVAVLGVTLHLLVGTRADVSR